MKHTPIQLKHLTLHNWDAHISYAVCEDIAALILPSSTIPISSPASCSCSLQTGELTFTKRNKYIRESTLREMDNVAFRVRCFENELLLSKISRQPDNPHGLCLLLKELFSAIEEDKIMLCYGGDIVSNAGTLQCIANAAVSFPNKRIVVKTGNSTALLDFSLESSWANAIQPDNVLFFQEDPGPDGNLLFPIISRKKDGAVPDSPNFFPEKGEYVALKQDPSIYTRRKLKLSWWQQAAKTNTKNNKHYVKRTTVK